jgi:hypothetical protein
MSYLSIADPPRRRSRRLYVKIVTFLKRDQNDSLQKVAMPLFVQSSIQGIMNSIWGAFARTRVLAAIALVESCPNLVDHRAGFLTCFTYCNDRVESIIGVAIHSLASFLLLYKDVIGSALSSEIAQPVVETVSKMLGMGLRFSGSLHVRVRPLTRRHGWHKQAGAGGAREYWVSGDCGMRT